MTYLIYVLFVAVVLIISITTAVVVAKKRKSAVVGMAFFLIQIVVVFGVDIFEKTHWSQLCHGTGVHVYRKLVVPGFFLDSTSRPIIMSYLQEGYAYIDAPGDSNRTYRARFTLMGHEPQRIRLNNDSSNVSVLSRDTSVNEYIFRQARAVVLDNTNEVLGEDVTLGFSGGPIFRFFAKVAREPWSSVCNKRGSEEDVVLATIPHS